MCMEEIDVKPQVSQVRRTSERGLNHLSKDAKCFFKGFACVDGTDRLGYRNCSIDASVHRRREYEREAHGRSSSRSEVLRMRILSID
jgi:hypothetical protein